MVRSRAVHQKPLQASEDAIERGSTKCNEDDHAKKRKNNSGLVVVKMTFVVVVLVMAAVAMIWSSPNDLINKEGNTNKELQQQESSHVTTAPGAASDSTPLDDKNKILRDKIECTLTSSINLPNDGLLQITLLNDLAPLSSAAFVELVENQYYDGVYIFRVLKDFIAQWGFRPDWKKKEHEFQPRPRSEMNDIIVEGKSLSNVRGTLTYAGGSNVQVFINLGDNTRLDKEGGRPFATLNSKSMELADALYNDYKDGDGQIAAISHGEDTVKEQFPFMSRIQSCRVVETFTTTTTITESE